MRTGADTRDAKGVVARRPRLSHDGYVVELAPAVLKEPEFRRRNLDDIEGKPCVYVGMTGLAVAERMANHKCGHKGNGFVLRTARDCCASCSPT